MFYQHNKLNVGKGLTDAQVHFIAEEIAADYPNFNFYDIKLVLKKGAKGEFGKLYDALDPKTILGWFATYHSERMEQFSIRKKRQHDKKKVAKPNKEFQLKLFESMREALSKAATKQETQRIQKSDVEIAKEKEMYSLFIEDCKNTGIKQTAFNFGLFKSLRR